MDATGLVVSPGMVDAHTIFLSRVVPIGKVMRPGRVQQQKAGYHPR